jgi:hypothetical protein
MTRKELEIKVDEKDGLLSVHSSLLWVFGSGKTTLNHCQPSRSDHLDHSGRFQQGSVVDLLVGHYLPVDETLQYLSVLEL